MTPHNAAMTDAEIIAVSRAEQTAAWNDAQADFLHSYPLASRDLDRAMRTAAMLALRARDTDDIDAYIEQVRALAREGLVDASLPDRLRHAVEAAT